jgi:putative nucleotidyltransferase with HDIG domain
MDISTEETPRVKIRRRIFQIKRLAAMPEVVFELVNAIGDDGAAVNQVVKIIESDQSLASRVLNLANSAYYGFAHQISTIERAVVAVGFDELRLLALSAGLSQVFDPKMAAKGWDGTAAWLHSLSVSWFCQKLAAKGKDVAPGEALVAGLLHDLGKLVLATYLPEEYAQVVARQAQGESCRQAEDALGYQHTVAGYWLAKRWDLPEMYIAAIRYHHNPLRGREHASLVALVALGDLLAHCVCSRVADDDQKNELSSVIGAAGLTPDDLREMASQGRRDLPEILARWTTALSLEGNGNGC